MSNDPSWWDLVDFLDLQDVDTPQAEQMYDDGLSIVSIEDLMDDQ